jgi:hypothetical protein
LQISTTRMSPGCASSPLASATSIGPLRKCGCSRGINDQDGGHGIRNRGRQ